MFHLLRLKSYPIYEQLLLEEKLLRCDGRNWCLINEGSPPAIVMGISGKKEELIDTAKMAENKIPLIKRFSGGGTVIVDENTLFITFICQKQLHDFPAYPEPIMKWTEQIYTQALQHPGFCLKENDYVIEDRKCGGNAQYIKKDRWLHHTSFLWEYSPEKMEYLLHPNKTPSYRAGRLHEEFLCSLSQYFSNKEEVIERIVQEIEKRFLLKKTSLEEALAFTMQPSRQSTILIT
ncbi:MAG: lipoate--protein ligase family protein [Rhabdochlamydiaceae bacterium]|jgi:lipoate-protein ligase A